MRPGVGCVLQVAEGALVCPARCPLRTKEVPWIACSKNSSPWSVLRLTAGLSWTLRATSTSKAPEVTYFDLFTERRVDGLDAMQVRLAPMKKMKPPFTDPRYEMVDPKVQRHGDVALLTFNLVNYGKLPGAPERVLARWNSTEVYSRIGGTWKIIHSHWSYI